MGVQAESEGYISHIVQIGYHSKWAVQLRKAEIYTKTPFPDPNPQPTPPTNIKATKASKADWTQEDKDRLMKRWVEVKPTTAMGKARELLKEFPGRSEQSLYLMYYGLTGGKATHSREPPAAATTKTKLEEQKEQVEEEHKLYSENELEKQLYIRREEMEEFIDSTLTLLKEEYTSRLEELHKRIVDLDLRVGTLENEKAELANEIEFLRADFKEHEHSEITHKPLVPP